MDISIKNLTDLKVKDTPENATLWDQNSTKTDENLVKTGEISAKNDENFAKNEENSTKFDRKADIYVGVDVFGRGCMGGGGFECSQPMKIIREKVN